MPARAREVKHALRAAAIEYVCGAQPSLACHANPDLHGVETRHGMRIGADLDADAAIPCATQPAPVEIETVRVGIGLHSDAALCRVPEHSIQIDRVWLSRQQQPSGGVSKHRDMGLSSARRRRVVICASLMPKRECTEATT